VGYVDRSDVVGLLAVGKMRQTAENVRTLLIAATILRPSTLIFTITTDNASNMRRAGDLISGGDNLGIG
jgi:hypothetical protein